MKSIRLSLIVYFLVLLTGALGAVSWFAYRTAADSLEQRKLDAKLMIDGAFQRRASAVREELDRRLVSQARALASLRLSSVHYEAVYAVSAIAMGAAPQGNREAWIATGSWLPPVVPKAQAPYVPVLFTQAKGPGKYEPAREITKFYPKYTHIDSSEFLVPDAGAGEPQEYFQTYAGKDGQPMQRSESMGDSWFTLDPERHEHAVKFTEYFDEVELKRGAWVRRVTLKTPVSGYGGVMFWWRPPGPNPKNAKQPAPPPKLVDTDTPTLFIQYAADTGPIEEQIRQFQRERTTSLADLEDKITRDLAELRDRMVWVSVVTILTLWVGGFLVIRLGLAPLSKMSDAVSKVSAQNFHLPLDANTLPNELRPIAARLAEVLDHLQKAFAREKQAAADISHELRTPLAALMTTLEVGLKKTRSPEEYREILDECRYSGQHMYQLVERLLTLARLDAGVDQYRPVPTDVTEVALNCADLIRPLARARGLALRLHLPDPIATDTDPNKLREVLTNLLHNAVEYNNPNGAIDLTVERANGTVRFEVRDTGIGIKPDQQSHLFERFYRADPSRHADTPHAGLGLAIVKSYVDLLGGTIKVESSDAGTAFIVELPYTASVHDLETAVQEAPVLVQR